MRNGRASLTASVKIPLSFRPNCVATTPGCSALLVTPVPESLRSQIASEGLHLFVTGGPADVRGGLLGLARVARQQHDAVALLRQCPGGDLADSRRRSRDQRDPFHATAGGRGPSRASRPSRR